jgi:hypothetical protein
MRQDELYSRPYPCAFYGETVRQTLRALRFHHTRWSEYATGCALLLCLAYVPPRKEAAIKRLRVVVCCGQYYYPLLDTNRIAASRPTGVCPMTASRLFGTGSAVHSWDSQASAAVPDIAHLHTAYLTPPEVLWPLLPTEPLSSSPYPPSSASSPHVTQAPRPLHPPLPAPELPPPAGPDPWDPWTVAIKEHPRAAQRLHEEADQLHHTLTVSSA